MAKLKFPPHVADKVLNHVSGTISGVAAVYNKFEYIDERRDALEAWGAIRQQFSGAYGGKNRVARQSGGSNVNEPSWIGGYESS